MSKKRVGRSGDFDFAIPVGSGKAVTARRAGDVTDLELCVSPSVVDQSIALRHMAKGINLALKYDFIESPLDGIYHASRVRDGRVYIQLLDRLEAKKIVTDWNRDEWSIETTVIGLDVMMTPQSVTKKKRSRKR
jgi:hypothetical protein